MSISNRIATLGAVAVLATLQSGCASDDDRDLPGPRLWESEHFRYHSRTDDQACEAVLEQLERHFELVQGYLGFPWPPERKVDYYKFRDQADYLRYGQCPSGADSCTRGSTVFSPHVLQDHELIHAYLAPLGMPPAFFAEGVAAAFACDHVFEIEYPEPWQEVVALPFGDRFMRTYLEGPWFVGYLLQRFGPEAFLSLYRQLDYQTATVDAISSVFESVYGEPLETVWNAGLDSSKYLRCVNLWNCSGASLPLDGSIEPLEQACDGSDNSRTFEVTAATDVVISSNRYFLYAPLSCNEDLPYYVGGGEEAYDYGTVWDATVVTVPAGKYFMKSAAQGGVPDVGIRALPSNTYSKDCSQLQTLDLAGDSYLTWDVRLTVPKDGNPWFVKVHPPSGGTFYTGSDATEEVQECSSCAETPTCVPLDDNAHPDSEGNVTLRLESPESGPGYASYLIRSTVIWP